MTAYLTRRFIALITVLLIASAVIFFAVNWLPGDAAEIQLGVNARDDTLAAKRAALGLDQPIVTRYLQWIGGIAQGDFGTSFNFNRPVTEMIADRLWVSLPLASFALILSAAIGIPLGAYAASRAGRLADALTMGFSQLGVAIPNFWFGILLGFVFAAKLRWLPAGSFPGWDESVVDSLRSLILPVIALALPQAAILARVTRSSLLETLGEDYVRTALAKGLSPGAMIWRHALRNALIPVVTILGLQFSFLIAGAIVIEEVFFLPGIGQLIFKSIAARDLITVQSLVLLLVAAVVFVNFIVDVTYAIIDPRLGGKGAGA